MAVIGREAGTAGAGTRDWTRVLSSRWMLAVILGLAFAVYAPSIGDWFSRDDFWHLRAGQANSVGGYIATSFDVRQTAPSSELDRYHPLHLSAWRLQYAVFGTEAAGYHAVLVALHLACTAIVWLIARRLFAVSWAANLATLVFAIHPAYAHAVAWAAAGSRVFMAFPYLLGLLFFIKYRDAERGRMGIWYVCSLIAFIVAILTHSSAVTLPGVLAAYTFLIAGTPRDMLRVRPWLALAPFAAVAMVEIGLQFWVRSHVGTEEGLHQFGFHQYGNYGQYLGLALQPVKGSDLSGARQDLIESTQLAASLIMLALTVAVIVRRPPAYLALFACVWFYIALLPDSTFTSGAFGRILYVPGAGLAIFLVAALLAMRDVVPPRLVAATARAGPYVIAIGVVASCALAFALTRNSHDEAARDERFAEALRAEGPEVAHGGTLYVVGAPKNLTEFDDSRLEALVQLYYGEIDVRSLLPQLAPALEPMLGANDRIYRYQP